MNTFQIPTDLFTEKGYKTVNGIPHFYRIIGEGEPFVFLPALAIERSPRLVCFTKKFSSSNFSP